MLEKKTISQCISADYCKGWNDAVDAVGYPGAGLIPVKYHEACLQLEIRRRIAAEKKVLDYIMECKLHKDK